MEQSLTAPANQSNLEGNTVSLQIQATDTGGFPLTYSATNLPTGLAINSSTGLISGTIAAGASAKSPFGVWVTATDGTYSSTQIFGWTITHSNNQPPLLTNPGHKGNVETDVVRLQIVASDPDNDPLTYSATGLPDGLTIDSASGLISGTISSTAVSHGPYAVTVTVNDGNGGVTSQSLCWMVNDAALAAQGANVSAAEGTPSGVVTLTTFTDRNISSQATDFTATIIWGDGATDTGTIGGSAGSYNVTGSHTYAHPGSFPVTVTISDSGGSTTTTSGTTSVAVALLSASGYNVGAAVGYQANLTVATFKDANPNEASNTYSATVNWGDLSASSGTISGSMGNFTITGSHTYSSNGTFTVTVTITDSDGTAATATTTVTVGDVCAGATAILTAGPFTNVPGGTPANSTATIIWGDGNTSTNLPVTGTLGNLSVTATHVYSQDGLYNVTITVISTGGQQTATGTVTASHSGITLFTNSFKGIPGQSLNNVEVASFTDTNPNTTSGSYTGTIDWGDGTPLTPGSISGSSGYFHIRGSHLYLVEGCSAIFVYLFLPGNIGFGGKSGGEVCTTVPGPPAIQGPTVVPGASSYYYRFTPPDGTLNVTWKVVLHGTDTQAPTVQKFDQTIDTGPPKTWRVLVDYFSAAAYVDIKATYTLPGMPPQTVILTVTVITVQPGNVSKQLPGGVTRGRWIAGVFLADEQKVLPGYHHIVGATDQARWDYFNNQTKKGKPPEASYRVKSAGGANPAIKVSTNIKLIPPLGAPAVDLSYLDFGFIQEANRDLTVNYVDPGTGAPVGKRKFKTDGEFPNIAAQGALDWRIDDPPGWPWYGLGNKPVTQGIKGVYYPYMIDMKDNPSLLFPYTYPNVNSIAKTASGQSHYWLNIGARTTSGSVYDPPSNTKSSERFFRAAHIKWRIDWILPVETGTKITTVENDKWIVATKFPILLNSVDNVMSNININWPYAEYPTA